MNTQDDSKTKQSFKLRRRTKRNYEKNTLTMTAYHAAISVSAHVIMVHVPSVVLSFLQQI